MQRSRCVWRLPHVAVAAWAAACAVGCKAPAPRPPDLAKDVAASAPLPTAPTQSAAGADRLEAVIAQQSAEKASAAAGPRTPGFVLIPAGRFTMGAPDKGDGTPNEAGQHEVTLVRAFEIQATETTARQFRSVSGANPELDATCQGIDDCPAAHVSWLQAVDYCNRLSEKHGLPRCYTLNGPAVVWNGGPGCKGFRLPTEAEWEYAARAGHPGMRHGDANAVSWYDENANLRIHSVQRKQPNAWGLYDMLGNVAEWVWDWYAAYPTTAQVDPTGPKGGENRVYRGGSWRYSDFEATFGARSAIGPDNRVEFIGFRCVRAL
ncbi:MAG: SUMF1/EgtB/PvdO family nonheme iron enzyme [Deltaproteobacteria bacterium]|nr:SUMF1/EgtB/PvdO family nonheme iron enzyme [Deltaproteobacteria bacterium]